MSSLRTFRRFAMSMSALVKPKRFYKEAIVVAVGTMSKMSFNISLDNKKLKTPSGRLLQLNSYPLALGIAQEWNAQKEEICMTEMRLTGLAFTAADNPHRLNSEEVSSKLVEYLVQDTILYHDGENEKLALLQKEKWGPILNWFNEKHETSLKPCYSVAEVPSIDASSRLLIQNHLMSLDLPALIGIQYAVEATKSLILTKAVLDRRIESHEAVELTNLEQCFQVERWGNVEWAHDFEKAEIATRLSAGILFAYFNINEDFGQKNPWKL
ncbi:hypothetical protein AB6A40_004774 [Gnathostoma spinigerum]|uniref:ATP synthase mitochondrial F1 complex assembly factor 2 n=1 Tax=Gnathostoma spinigerum TaxID=75299 RepID=A0ABD6EDJ0_9BILA